MPSEKNDILELQDPNCTTEAEVIISEDLKRFIDITHHSLELTVEDVKESSATALKAYNALKKFRGIIMNNRRKGVTEFFHTLENILVEKCIKEADEKNGVYYNPKDLDFFRQHARTFMNRGYLPIGFTQNGNQYGSAILPADQKNELENISFIYLKKLPNGIKYCNISKPLPPEKIMLKIGNEGLGFSEKNEGSHVSIATVSYKRNEGKRIIQNSIEWSTNTTVPRGTMDSEFLEQSRQYGTALFEGIGVEMAENGDVLIFRLKDHAERMSKGGNFFDMPEIPAELFEEMVINTVKANINYLPKAGEGRLYIRPNWYDKGPKMHVGSSDLHALTMTAVTIGSMESYFEPGRKVFFIPRNFYRASDNGMGQTKAAGNYSQTIRINHRAKEKDMTGILYSDPANQRVEETLASSFIKIVRKNDVIKLKTPGLKHKTILDSITRKTVLELAKKELKWDVEEDEDLRLEDLNTNDEEILGCFAVGTGAGLAPIHAIKFGNFNNDTGEIEDIEDEIELWDYDEKNPWGDEGRQLMELILNIKSGKLPEYENYLTKVKE